MGAWFFSPIPPKLAASEGGWAHLMGDNWNNWGNWIKGG
jgi:hypothetical protein